MNNIDAYLRIVDYDFSENVLSDKVVVKFKIEKNIEPYDFLTIFSDRAGERFAIKTPNKREVIVGIGHEYTWHLDSNDFLKSYNNTGILDEFNSLVTQVTDIDIDELSQNYFGMYGGISDGENKNSQEWIDFSDTLFFIPSILAVFYEDEIEFTLFFKVKKEQDFITLWKDRILFLLKIDNLNKLELEEPKIKNVREIYPEVWQENIRLAIENIKEENFERIALLRKNQVQLEKRLSLPATVKYFSNKKLSFMAFESRKSMFITSNPLLSFTKKEDFIKSYLYLQKESLFSGIKYIDFQVENIEEKCKKILEDVTKYKFGAEKDKTLVGKNLDIYSVFTTRGCNDILDIKILSLMYPMNIIKGYPYEATTKFLSEYENTGQGFLFNPIGFISSDLDASFYTCGNMLVSFSNILTIFTTMLIDENIEYDEVLEQSNSILEKTLRLFNVNNGDSNEVK